MSETIEIAKPAEILTTVDEVIASMQYRFHPENCQTLKAIYQWQLKNPDRYFYITIDCGTFFITEGEHPTPNVTVETDTAVYLKLVNGQMKDVIAVVTGKLRVRGSISTAQKLNRIFI
jgi:putative sterol carrier protein